MIRLLYGDHESHNACGDILVIGSYTTRTNSVWLERIGESLCTIFIVSHRHEPVVSVSLAGERVAW